MPLSPAKLRRTAAAYVPTLGEDGEVDRLILLRMDGTCSLEAVARQLAHEFPGRFASWKEALSRVGELSKTYSREPGDADSFRVRTEPR
jgi:hypothetical protein